VKKILWLSHLLPYPPKGGVLQRSYNLLKEVSKEYEVTLLAFNQKNLCAHEVDKKAAINQLSQFCKVIDVSEIESEKSIFNRVKLLASGLLPHKTYTISWLSSRGYQNQLTELLSKSQFDLIHVDTISLAPYVKSLKHAKKVLNHHNIESLMMLRRAENEKNIFKKIYFWQEGIKLKAFEKRVCPTFDLNVTCSKLDSERLNQFAPNIQCVDIPNGVDLTYFKPEVYRGDRKSIIFAGGLSWYPNLDAMTFFLKSIWPLLVEKIPDISFTLIGRSPPDWMIAMQKEYKNLHVTGFVDDVRPYFKQSAVYVCPIRDGGGTKLKVLDALAMQIPLVADPIACEGINVTNGESVFFAASPEEYVKTIQNIFADYEAAMRIAENGLKLIQNEHDFTKIGEKLSNCYRSIINN
jgi:glycosyltransferase involved in cell wall biosynthesis